METSNSLINADLVRQVEELVNGARITAITSNAEFTRYCDLGKLAKRTLVDLEADYDKAVKPRMDAVQEVRDAYFPKRDALKGLIDNARQVCGAWQLEQKRLADEEARRKEAEKIAAQKALAEIESKRLEEEERLRAEAAEKIRLAEAETDAKKRAELIEQANTAAAVADIAQGEAVQAAQAVQEVKVEQVQTFVPRSKGFSPKVDYSANVLDYRAALKAIVDAGDYAYLEGKKFQEVIQAACDKIAKLRGKEFKWPGCTLRESIGGALGTGLRRQVA